MDELSLVSVYIEIYFDDTLLSNATGFIIKVNNCEFLTTTHDAVREYVVTNGHVVTGRHAETGKLLHSKLAIPNKLKIFFHKKTSSEKIERICIDYLLDDGAGISWLGHPIGNTIDVVLIPLKKDNSIVSYEIDLRLASTDMIVEPAMPISIIGFPDGKDAGELPIWVSGFVASEPEININGLPCFFVNASGYEGLSGSPVICKLLGGSYRTANNNVILNNQYNKKFMGIYSGRLEYSKEKGKGLMIGRVWKPVVIEEIILHYASLFASKSNI